MGIKAFLVISNLVLFHFCNAQQKRLKDNNSIGWYNIFTTTKLNSKWSIHAEFQFRRVDFAKNGQQNLFRTGINFQPDKSILFRLGYANVETFSYGDYPINALGKQFTEHRIFEMISIQNKFHSADLSNRFMLEQRFNGKYSSADLTKEDEYVFLNRIRYMFRLQIPIGCTKSQVKKPYIGFYDEVFLGFGKNVGENIFDQNRIGALLGYKLNETAKFELGYLNQIVQLSREIDSKNVFQYNSGLLANIFLNF
ncbi:MAG: DUF2490 domain-containing protein [Sphingobacteriales bacterium]|nr:DUF2490 domain-containing protein [Sphingobacteriales bacterium]